MFSQTDRRTDRHASSLILNIDTTYYKVIINKAYHEQIETLISLYSLALVLLLPR